jgi:hypothetical protein
MTGRGCPAAHRRRIPLLVLSSVAMILLLAGCQNFKQTVGIERTPPDEFEVESRAPLTMPPDYNLRPPEPGAERPQEVSTAAKAKQAIDSAGPGEPGKQASGQGLVYPGSAGRMPDQGNPNAQVAPNSLSARLLGYQGSGAGASVEDRATTPLQGVY